MKQFIIGIDWNYVAEQSKIINWSAHASIAFPQHSKEYASFKKEYDLHYRSKSTEFGPRGINYTYYVRLIATCKALGLIK